MAEELPRRIQTGLESELNDANGNALDTATVSQILVRIITELDEAILHDFHDLFPGGAAAIEALSADDIRAIMEPGGVNHTKVMRCMQGSTVLVSLIDPAEENLWVASLGDCQAGLHRISNIPTPSSEKFLRTVLGTRTSSNTWISSLLSSNHNANNKTEVARIRQEHPDEHQCVLHDRVLGSIAVTRGI